jgi:hypothetical protein
MDERTESILGEAKGGKVREAKDDLGLELSEGWVSTNSEEPTTCAEATGGEGTVPCGNLRESFSCNGVTQISKIPAEPRTGAMPETVKPELEKA